MLKAMDSAIGEVVVELKRLGHYQNTIIIFTSDVGKLFTKQLKCTVNISSKLSLATRSYNHYVLAADFDLP